ncbi:radical SAM protein, partial [candidate division KSB1 bacterium]|nr:radical SAM protein [candidate division KSB1 bacterium]
MTDHPYKYLFGPVPSRRLGISLGIDLIPPKTCSLNCIYCECGRTTKLTITRKEYVPTDEVIAELKHFLGSKPKLDYITYSGSGEPTLHSGIGRITESLKTDFPDYRIALLTNGTLFYQPGLIEEVQAIDVILPSLDAVSDDVFIKINRPLPSLKIEAIVEGLIELRKKYPGPIWLEIFIVPGLNDSDAEIEKIATVVGRIQPERIQLNTLDRPGAVAWVEPASKSVLEKIAQKLGDRAEIIAHFRKREQVASYNADVESAILQTIKRRPCTVDDLSS